MFKTIDMLECPTKRDVIHNNYKNISISTQYTIYKISHTLCNSRDSLHCYFLKLPMIGYLYPRSYSANLNTLPYLTQHTPLFNTGGV